MLTMQTHTTRRAAPPGVCQSDDLCSDTVDNDASDHLLLSSHVTGCRSDSSCRWRESQMKPAQAWLSQLKMLPPNRRNRSC